MEVLGEVTHTLLVSGEVFGGCALHLHRNSNKFPYQAQFGGREKKPSVNAVSEIISSRLQKKKKKAWICYNGRLQRV